MFTTLGRNLNIAALIIGVFITICITIRNTYGYDIGERIGACIVALMVSTAAILLILGFNTLVVAKVCSKWHHPEYPHTSKIASMSLDSKYQESFFICIGSFESRDYYYYMEEGAHGYQLHKKLTTDRSIWIKNDCPEGTNPYIERSGWESGGYNSFGSLFLIPDGIDFMSDGNLIFHLPPGSIINKYDIDLDDLK